MAKKKLTTELSKPCLGCFIKDTATTLSDRKHFSIQTENISLFQIPSATPIQMLVLFPLDFFNEKLNNLEPQTMFY